MHVLLTLAALAYAQEVDEAEGAAPAEEEAPAPETPAAAPPADARAADAPAAGAPAADAPPADAPAADGAPAQPPDGEPPSLLERNRSADQVLGFDASTLMLGYGAGYGGYLGGALTYAVREDGVKNGVVLGAGAGALTMYLLMPEDTATKHPILLGSGSTLGGFTGIQTARSFIKPGAEREQERIALAGILGSVAGTGLAVAAYDKPPSSEQMLRTDLGAFIGWQMAAGAADAADLDPVRRRNLRAPLALAGAFGVGGAAYALGGNPELRPGVGLMALSISHGAWVGAWMPTLFASDPTDLQRLGGLRLGLGGGYVAATVLAPIGEPGARSTTLQLVGASAGNALGAGIPLAAGVDPESNPRAVVAPMLLSGMVGQVGGALASPYYEPSANDAVMLSALGTWTAYQTIGWGFYGGHLGVPPSRTAGYALTSGGTGAVLALALVPAVELTPAESTMMASMGGWGTWYGGWGGHLLRMDPAAHWFTTLQLGNLGVVTTGAILTSSVDPEWGTVGLVNGMGLLGGAGGALVGVVASPDADVVAAGSLVGSTAGLTAGVVMAMRGEPAGGSDLRLPELGLGRMPYQPSIRVSPWMAENGDPGAHVQLDLREVARR